MTPVSSASTPDWFAFLRERKRHLWIGDERVHVEVRPPQPGSQEERLFAQAVRSLSQVSPISAGPATTRRLAAL